MIESNLATSIPLLAVLAYESVNVHSRGGRARDSDLLTLGSGTRYPGGFFLILVALDQVQLHVRHTDKIDETVAAGVASITNA